MGTSHKLFIGGTWVHAQDGDTFERFNPANVKEKIGTFSRGKQEDIDAAVDAAEEALPTWQGMPAPKRGELLFNVTALLRKHKQELGELVTREMGKVLPEALGDVQEAIDVAEYMAGEGRRLFGHTTPSELPDKAAFTTRMPLGVVGLITPWNFPTAIPAWKIMPALICGNTFVLKPAEQTPLCAVRMIEILEKAGVPKGVANLVTGFGEDAGAHLVQHKKVSGISFTGSRAVGEYVTKHAGLKKVGLELGGKNAIIIMEDADLSLALDGVLWGGFGTTGQRCTASSRVILHEGVADKFSKHLTARVEKLKLGDGLKKDTDVGPLVEEAAMKKTHLYTEIGQGEGAKLLCGGKEHSELGGHFYQPTLFGEVTRDMRIAQEEIFGPTVSLIPEENLQEAIATANSVEYGLSSAIYTKNVNHAFKAIEKLDTGIVYVNASTIGAEVHLPFGGSKATGNGTREAGIEGIHEFSETKTVYVDYSGTLQRAQIDNVED